MIFAKNIKSLWQKHGEELKKFYVSEQNKPVLWGNLETMPFTDTKGKRYGRFPADMALPVARLAKLMLFYQYLSKGLSPEEDAQIDNAIESALMEGVTVIHQNGVKGVNENGWYARVLALIHERRKRKDLTDHMQLFYNILAVQIVREDESPTDYNEEIQREKVLEFANNETPERAMFFFQQPELKNLTGLSKLSMQDVETLLIRSKREQELLQMKISQIKDFRPSKTTSGSLSGTGKKV